MIIGDHGHLRLYHFELSTEAIGWVGTGLAKTSLITSDHNYCIHLHHGEDDDDDDVENLIHI